MGKEIWKDVTDYEGYYQVSNFGRIKSLPRKYRKGKIIYQNPLPHTKYFVVRLAKDGVNHTHSVHRIVAKSFIPNPENKPEVNHKNGNRQDNRPENLEWVTKSENNLHAFRVLGRKANSGQKGKFGEDSWKSKAVNQLTPEGELIKKYPSLRSTLEDFGDRVSISACCNGKKKTGLYMGFKWEWA